MPNLFKIGYSNRSAKQRLPEINSATGVPGKFHILKKWKLVGAEKVEKIIHRSLQSHRLDKEFFKFDTSDDCIDSVSETLAEIGRLDGEGKTEPELVGNQALMLREEQLIKEGPLRNGYVQFCNEMFKEHRISLKEAARQFADIHSGGKISRLKREGAALQKQERERGFLSSILNSAESEANREKGDRLYMEVWSMEKEAEEGVYQAAQAAVSYLYWKSKIELSWVRFDQIFTTSKEQSKGVLYNAHINSLSSFEPFPVYRHTKGSYVEREAIEDFALEYSLFVDCSPSAGGSATLEEIADQRRKRTRDWISVLESLPIEFSKDR